MNNRFYKELLDNLYDGVYFLDQHRRVTYWNKGAERLTGYTSQEVLGKNCSDNILMHINENGMLLCHGMCPAAMTINDGLTREEELYLHHKDGYRLPVLVRVAPIIKDGKIQGAVEIFSDNSAKVSAMERIDNLKRAIYCDPLTGLANRTFIEISLTTNIQEMKEFHYSFGILFMDIDKFKNVNDNYGHNIGDEILMMVTKTLLMGVRPLDIVGRWAGDEFIVVLSNIDKEQLAEKANKIRHLVEQSSITLGKDILHVTASIGATLAYPGDTVPDLINRADKLMYLSKKKGGNRVSMGN